MRRGRDSLEPGPRGSAAPGARGGGAPRGLSNEVTAVSLAQSIDVAKSIPRRTLTSLMVKSSPSKRRVR